MPVIAELAADCPAAQGTVGIAFPERGQDPARMRTAANIDPVLAGRGRSGARAARARPPARPPERCRCGRRRRNALGSRPRHQRASVDHADLRHRHRHGAVHRWQAFSQHRARAHGDARHGCREMGLGQVRTVLQLDWPAWIDRVNDYLARMHALFWPDLFILGGAVSERFDGFCAAAALARRRSARRISPGRRASSARRSPPPNRTPRRPCTPSSGASLPDVGTTIFTVMSRRARELGALNLGQGFPDYDIDPRLDRAGRARPWRRPQPVRARWKASLALRERIAPSSAARTGCSVDPEIEITVTLRRHRGHLLGHPGGGRPGRRGHRLRSRLRLLRAGGAPRRRALHPPAARCRRDFRYDWDARARGASPQRTRLILFNSPHNPAARRPRPRISTALAAVSSAIATSSCCPTRSTSTWCTTGARTIGAERTRSSRETSFAVFSFGKTLHATGLRVGYCVAPAGAHARAAQGAPVQHLQHRAPAAGWRSRAIWSDKPRGVARRCRAFFQAKRDRLRARAGRQSASRCRRPQGTYLPAAGFQRACAAGRPGVRRAAAQRGRRRHDPAVAVLRAAAGRARCCGCASPSGTPRSMRPPQRLNDVRRQPAAREVI